MNKRRIAVLVVLMALTLAAGAAAEFEVGDELRVVNCKEYVTLREEASKSADALARIPLGQKIVCLEDDNGEFVRVWADGRRGYVLRRYLDDATTHGHAVTLTDAQRADMNLFLSNFTETSLSYYCEGVFDVNHASPAAMVEFAAGHIWFNQNRKVEWGDYANGNNVRLATKYINPVLRKYFGVTVDDIRVRYLDLDGDYLYWQETGGHVPDGFASVTSAEYLGSDWYRVYFDVYGEGEDWNNDVMKLTGSQAASLYQRSSRSGFAMVLASDLDNRASYKLIRFVY